jgi:hypothetical protein
MLSGIDSRNALLGMMNLFYGGTITQLLSQYSSMVLGGTTNLLSNLTGADGRAATGQFGGQFMTGFSLNVPLYNYEMMKSWDYQYTTEFGRRVERRDPVIIDWNRDGNVSTKGKDNSAERISFDVNGDGLMDRTEWVKGDALLVYDANGDGIINNGRELMNEVGVDGTQGKYANGWEKMRDLFDTNKDGLLTDAELDKVQVWVDKNADGRTDPGELISAKDAGIVYINLSGGGVMRREPAGALDFNFTEAVGAGGQVSSFTGSFERLMAFKGIVETEAGVPPTIG